MEAGETEHRNWELGNRVAEPFQSRSRQAGTFEQSPEEGREGWRRGVFQSQGADLSDFITAQDLWFFFPPWLVRGSVQIFCSPVSSTLSKAPSSPLSAPRLKLLPTGEEHGQFALVDPTLDALNDLNPFAPLFHG